MPRIAPAIKIGAWAKSVVILEVAGDLFDLIRFFSHGSFRWIQFGTCFSPSFTQVLSLRSKDQF
jgi:hypothetical protein